MRLLLSVLALLAAVPAHADGPRARLILAPGVDALTLFSELEQPRWATLKARAGLAALNANVVGPHTADAGRLSLLVGRRVDSRRMPPSPDMAALRELADLGVPVAFAAPGDPPDSTAALTVVTVPGGPAAALRAAAAAPPGELVLLTSPDPGRPARNSRTRLAPLLVVGPGHAAGWLTSATTRTAGLVANVDLLPTLLEHLRLEVPGNLEGRPLRPAPGARRTPADLARHAAATHDLMTPGLLAWGVLSFLAVAFALAAAGRGNPVARRAARLTLTAAFAVAPALLLAAGLPAAGPLELAGRIVLITLMLTGIAARARRGAPLFVVLAALAGGCLFDLLGPQVMLPTNLMSDFPNVGARFYGIGNEWEALLLAATLILPFWLAEPAHDPPPALRGQRPAPDAAPRLRLFAVLLWGVTLIAVGLPPFGADFGGALTFALAYCLAAAVFATPDADPARRLRLLAAGLSLAALLVAGLVAFDLARPPTERTHIGNFAARALAGDWQPVLTLLARKVALNLEMARSPFFLGGLAAAAPLLWLCRRRLEAPIRAVLAARPALAAGLKATLAGGLLGLALNDTGVITWGLCTAAVVVIVLDQTLETHVEP